jgi:Protein of unknown function (DUF1501)
MERRDFLKLSGLTGLSLLLPWGASSQAHAEDLVYPGPYFLHMHAGGGWDPTMFCDGKLTAQDKSYENKLITQSTEVNGVPVPTNTANGKFLYRNNNQAVEDPKHFFDTLGSRILVVNGIDTQTNNHETGVQGFACGHNNTELACISALLAGKVALEKKLPMAFLAGGQYNRTGDIVSASRFPGDKINAIAAPFKPDGAQNEGILTDYSVQRIAQARQERFAALQAEATLPRTKRTLRALDEATRGGGAISLLTSITKDARPDFNSFRDRLPADCIPYMQQNFVNQGAQIENILRCFKAGVSVSATFDQGGFDTHANHDQAQQQAMGAFVSRIRYAMLRSQDMGIADKLFILVTSDFGRTPLYNMGNGKDHWNVTSALVIGPGIRAGRAVGKSDASQKAMRVVPGNIANTVSDKDTSGARIHPSHIHRELRQILGLDKAPFAGQFPLPSGPEHSPLPILT